MIRIFDRWNDDEPVEERSAFSFGEVALAVVARVAGQCANEADGERGSERKADPADDCGEGGDDAHTIFSRGVRWARVGKSDVLSATPVAIASESNS